MKIVEMTKKGILMRTTKTLVISVLVAFGLLATTQVANAAPKKQTVKFSVTGDCKDEQEMIEGESTNNCKIVVQMSSTTPARSAILEQRNEDDGWDQVSKASSRKGKITFSIDATDEDDAWLDGDFTFRVTVKKSAANKAVFSEEYILTFINAESSAESSAEDEEGTGEGSAKQKSKGTGNKKLDGVLDDMDNKNTKYDDDCKKSFGTDCKSMFTPTGPDWTKLTPAKWQTMCEQLLRLNAANCKMMYGKSMPPPDSSGSYALSEASIRKVCTDVGIKDCGPVVTMFRSPTMPTESEMKNLLGNKFEQVNQRLFPSSGGSGVSGSPNEASIRKACTDVGIKDCGPVVDMFMDPKPSSAEEKTLLGDKFDAFMRALFPSSSGPGGSNNKP